MSEFSDIYTRLFIFFIPNTNISGNFNEVKNSNILLQPNMSEKYFIVRIVDVGNSFFFLIFFLIKILNLK